MDLQEPCYFSSRGWVFQVLDSEGDFLKTILEKICCVFSTGACVSHATLLSTVLTGMFLD